MATSTLLLGLASLQGAHAWGVLGHATIAYVAQNYLTAATESWAQGILGDTSTSYLASIASWADDYRETKAGAYSAPYHFIDAQDNPPTTCDVNYSRDCTSAGCSISAIANYTQRVADGRLSAENTLEALKFIVHFVGDITQPLHDEALDVGGNTITVTFDGYDDDNLHADWDTYMPEKLIGGDTLADAQSWANTLIADIQTGTYKSVAASWIAKDTLSNVITTATNWATDANALVCTVVMPNGVAALQKGDLYPTYYDSVIPTIELQIAKAGYRLGNWLNLIYETNVLKKRYDAAGIMSRMAEEDFEAPMGPVSREFLAREAAGGGCGCEKHKHKH
ncbi:hypothetical protein N431DRAFT_400243 [Stipitochalara longipes BDJ]|nr:hypothetical protein N431DRAFT_400243 [Stipitochalara longipes BDJ]